MEDIVKFSNPATYLLSHNLQKDFVMAFWAMIGIFYGYLFVLGVSSGFLYRSLTGTVSQPPQVKMFQKTLSLTMLLLLNTLTVPILTLFLQVFNCDEDPLV